MTAVANPFDQSSVSPSLYADEILPSNLLEDSPEFCRQKEAIPSTSNFPKPFYNQHPLLGPPLQQVPIFESQSVQTAGPSVPAEEDPLSVSKDFVRPARDLNILEDDRVLCNLMGMEEKSQPKRDYFQTVQIEITAHMRKIVTQWMAEVCEEEKADPEVFPLACNYLDRFLSKEPVYKTQLQGLACTCLFVASKIKQPQPISSRKLVEYTDNYIQLGQLMSWELLLLNRLSWDTSAVTAFDFVDHLLIRMQLPSCLISRMRPVIVELIRTISTEFQLAVLQPSLQACICICVAGVRVLEDTEALSNLLAGIQSAIGTDPELLRFYVEGVEKFLKQNESEQAQHNPGSENAS